MELNQAPKKIKGMYNLHDLFLSIETKEEFEALIKDLCTPAEIKAMRERWLVAQLLSDNELSYRQIHEETGVSIATITRVARFLLHENNSGYKMMLKKLKSK